MLEYNKQKILIVFLIYFHLSNIILQYFNIFFCKIWGNHRIKNVLICYLIPLEGEKFLFIKLIFLDIIFYVLFQVQIEQSGTIIIKFQMTNDEILSGQLLYKIIIFIHVTNED